MEKAIIISVLALFVLLGLHKAVEWLEDRISVKGKNPVVLIYDIGNERKNAELIIRSLAKDSRKITSAKRSAVYIVSDDLDIITLDICSRTAEQYSNVFVGAFENAKNLLKEKNT